MSIKFTELPELTTLTDEDIFALVHSNTSYKATLQSLFNLFMGELSTDHPSINAVENAGDYIVSKGLNNGWYVWYLDSGVCFARRTGNQVVSDAANPGGNFYNKVGDLIAVPPTFQSVNSCYVTAGAASANGPYFTASVIQQDTSGIKAAFWAPDWYTTVSMSTIKVNYFIIGTYDRSIFS